MLRAGIASAMILVLLLVALVTPRLVDMRYLNLPLIHPWPPQGYAQNPFNPSDRADVISTSEAGRVKADLLADGTIETTAAATGDESHLAEADTGRSLESISRLLATNRSQGLFQRTATRLDSIVVGRLPDPNDPRGVSWCVEERGTALLTFVARDTADVRRTSSVQFRIRFWLVSRSGRYVIADSLVMS